MNPPPLSHTTTRVALATPPGEGGIHVLLLHGPGAPRILSGLLRPRPRGRLSLGRIELHGQVLDEVLVVTLATDPPLYEIDTHGGPRVARTVMEAFVAAGAEAVAWPAVVPDLPAARDPLCRAAFIALPTARSRLEAEILSRQAMGALSAVFAPCDADLTTFLQGKRPDDLTAFLLAAKTLLQGAPLARAFEDPPLVILTGAPNAGKSSLFNALLGEERALVHAAPGTTRDIVTETALFFGIPVLLCDTAGLTQHPTNPVEAEGVRRARALFDRARLLLHLGASPPAQAPVLQLAPKADLPRPRTGLPVSAKTGQGLDQLRREVLSALGLPPDPAASPPPPYPAAFADALAAAEQAAAYVLDAPEGALDRLTATSTALSLWREKSP